MHRLFQKRGREMRWQRILMDIILLVALTLAFATAILTMPATGI
ncbi:MAG TPA: hypothetical protein VKB71_09050 [Rhizomicrobium sp.]|nr:hypothetical protein [Rhizomicrobium sp.]